MEGGYGTINNSLPKDAVQKSRNYGKSPTGENPSRTR